MSSVTSYDPSSITAASFVNDIGQNPHRNKAACLSFQERHFNEKYRWGEDVVQALDGLDSFQLEKLYNTLESFLTPGFISEHRIKIISAFRKIPEGRWAELRKILDYALPSRIDRRPNSHDIAYMASVLADLHATIWNETVETSRALYTLETEGHQMPKIVEAIGKKIGHQDVKELLVSYFCLNPEDKKRFISSLIG